jgi:hypothetical protein
MSRSRNVDMRNHCNSELSWMRENHRDLVISLNQAGGRANRLGLLRQEWSGSRGLEYELDAFSCTWLALAGPPSSAESKNDVAGLQKSNR